PYNVFLVRGNHDSNFQHKGYDISSDIHMLLKFGLEKYDPNAIIEHFYNALPVALFIGCNGSWIQCCHGGIEPGYDPDPFLRAEDHICFQAFFGLCRKLNLIEIVK